jgi:hypothetical protein
VCCSFLSSISSMGRSGELSNFERGLVIGCHIRKKSVRDIATLLKLPSSETLVDFQRATQCYVPEDSTLHNHCCENLKSCRRHLFTCSVV